MILRKLEQKDAQEMLEWMYDLNVTSGLGKDFMNMTIEDCRKFIENAQNIEDSIHMAICEDNDIYQGTVSLKNIDRNNGNAEYAISIKTSAMGKGVSSFGTNEILKIAFEKLKLHKVYLNVSDDNIRAIKFYEKMKFRKEAIFKEHIYKDTYKDLYWYCMLAQDYEIESKNSNSFNYTVEL